MQIELNTIVTSLFAFFGGGGLGMAGVKLFMQSEAKKAMKEDLKNINKAITELKEAVTNDYVTCKYCNMQHDNLNTTIQNMDHKLDILIERKLS